MQPFVILWVLIESGFPIIWLAEKKYRSIGLHSLAQLLRGLINLIIYLSSVALTIDDIKKAITPRKSITNITRTTLIILEIIPNFLFSGVFINP